MSRRTRIILAYDKSEFTNDDRGLLERIAPYIDLVKVGVEAMTAENAVNHRTLASLVREFTVDILDKDVMWDMKLHDIANTMGKAAQNIVSLGSRMFTLHATASDPALQAAAKAAQGTGAFLFI